MVPLQPDMRNGLFTTEGVVDPLVRKLVFSRLPVFTLTLQAVGRWVVAAVLGFGGSCGDSNGTDGAAGNVGQYLLTSFKLCAGHQNEGVKGVSAPLIHKQQPDFLARHR